MISLLQKVPQILKVHWLAVLLVGIGTWLRFTHLPDQGILFGESGRELLVAAEAVDQHKLPFQPDSVTLWLEMALYRWVGYEPNFYYWVFAGIGSVSLVALYEFCLVWLNQRLGLIALTLLSFSPLAIAHSRMVYHTAPLVLATVLGLWAVAAVWRQLSSRKPQRRTIMAGCIGIGLFLVLPIMLEIQNPNGPTSGNLLTDFSHIISLASSLGMQLGIASLILAGLGWGSWRWWQAGRIINPGKAAIWLVSGVVSLAYLLSGPPSENELLVYCVLLPLLMAVSWAELPKWGKWVGISSLVILSTVNVITLHQHHFLVDQNEGWSYGPSLGTHRQIITWARAQTQNAELVFSSQDQSQLMPHYFDSYIWSSRGVDIQSSPVQAQLRLDFNSSDVQSTPLIFTSFHGKLPWSKTLYTPSVTAYLLP